MYNEGLEGTSIFQEGNSLREVTLKTEMEKVLLALTVGIEISEISCFGLDTGISLS